MTNLQCFVEGRLIVSLVSLVIYLFANISSYLHWKKSLISYWFFGLLSLRSFVASFSIYHQVSLAAKETEETQASLGLLVWREPRVCRAPLEPRDPKVPLDLWDQELEKDSQEFQEEKASRRSSLCHHICYHSVFSDRPDYTVTVSFLRGERFTGSDGFPRTARSTWIARVPWRQRATWRPRKKWTPRWAWIPWTERWVLSASLYDHLGVIAADFRYTHAQSPQRWCVKTVFAQKKSQILNILQ